MASMTEEEKFYFIQEDRIKASCILFEKNHESLTKTGRDLKQWLMNILN